MISTKYDMVVVTQVNDHAFRISGIQQARSASQQILNRGGREQVCQPMFENLSDPWAQFAYTIGFLLADCAKRFGVKGKFQGIRPSQNSRVCIFVST